MNSCSEYYWTYDAPRFLLEEAEEAGFEIEEVEHSMAIANYCEKQMHGLITGVQIKAPKGMPIKSIFSGEEVEIDPFLQSAEFEKKREEILSTVEKELKLKGYRQKTRKGCRGLTIIKR